ncbi:MAG TPA: sulfotransferase [Bacteroidales bacterium]|nr:sulfotransferase [Bacteroidales bacterium]
MKNCIILGFGRSGTSLMGGILYHSGYFMGEDLYPPRESNPKGFFENEFINGINESILAPYDYSRLHETGETLPAGSSPFNPRYGQRWLSHIDSDIPIDCEDEVILTRIREAVSVPVFAYKDPRFSYTLPVWKNFLPDNIVILCLFRNPASTARSVIKDCQSADYLADFQIDENQVFRLWMNSYTRLLANIRNKSIGPVRFIHYQQLLSGQVLPALSQWLDMDLDRSFISPELNRSHSGADIPEKVSGLYKTLCDLAGYQPVD